MDTKYIEGLIEIVFDNTALCYRLIGPKPLLGPREILKGKFESFGAAREQAERINSAVTDVLNPLNLPGKDRK